MNTKKQFSILDGFSKNGLYQANQNTEWTLFHSYDDSQAILARIAHEISNSFTFIGSNIQLMGDHNPKLRKTTSWNQLESDSNDISNFLHDFSTYICSDQLFFDEVNIIGLCTKIVEEATQKASEKNVNLTFLTGEPSYLCLTHYLCDGEKMRLALSNVLNWLIDTSDANSTIHIKLPSNMDDFHIHNNSIQYMKLQLSSDGMTQFEHLEDAIYHPSPDNNCVSTNLSMAIVHRILQAHKGGILFEASQNQNIATIYLPV